MDYLAVLRARLADIIDERVKTKADLDANLTAATAEQRDLSADEQARHDALKGIIADIDKRRAEVEARIAELETIEADAAAVQRVVPVAPAVVRRDERTYSPDAEKRGTSFLRDVMAASLAGDPDARQRLHRHTQEEIRDRGSEWEQRAVATTNFAGLVVPQYLTDMVAPTARAKRPFADICTMHPLPASGMTVNISRITTGTSTAVQSTQNSAVSETNMDDTLLSVDVQTFAGQQTVARQAIDRGTGIESIVLGDLVGSLNTLLDNTLINQATNGLDAITDANIDVAYTDATPTVAELWPKLADVIQQIQSAVFDGATHWLMHPRRFWWLASSVGTSFPFVQLPQSAPQVGGTVVNNKYDGVAGFLLGLPVVLDANIVTNGGAGTNEDRIYAVTDSECHLWEDDTLFIRAEQTNAASLGVLFVVAKYAAYTFGRYPSANGRINGTGLVTPTF